MTLPKLEVPTFELTLPSTKKKITFRPFLVKEHKTLLMMKDSSGEEISRIVEEIVNICTFNKLKKDTPNFDIEYIFTKIRAKSIGEKVDLVVTCNSCGHQNPFRLNLEEMNVQHNPDHKQKFMINDTVGIEMKYPKFNLNLYDLIESGLDNYFKEILSCIKAIYTSDGKYFDITVDDKEELDEFVSMMTSEQFEKIEEFFLTMPKLSHNIKLKCEKCSKDNVAKLEGLSNFFV